MPLRLQSSVLPHAIACVLAAGSLIACADRAATAPAGEPSGASSAAAPVPAKGMSREDDCRGPAELCKQDSAK